MCRGETNSVLVFASETGLLPSRESPAFRRDRLHYWPHTCVQAYVFRIQPTPSSAAKYSPAGPEYQDGRNQEASYAQTWSRDEVMFCGKCYSSLPIQERKHQVRPALFYKRDKDISRMLSVFCRYVAALKTLECARIEKKLR